MVVTVDRGRYTVLMGAPDNPGVRVIAMRARELGRRGIAVGDQVSVIGDLSGAPDALARIVRIAERETSAPPDGGRHRSGRAGDRRQRRSAGHRRLAGRSASSLRADRPVSVAALTEGMEPLLCLTKSDLAPPDEALARYAELDLPSVVTGLRQRPWRSAGCARRTGLGARQGTPEWASQR